MLYSLGRPPVPDYYTCPSYNLPFPLQIFKKQNEKIENLQRTVNAQAALISSQTEMLKEINKKLLENEQKLADFLHTKGVVCGKRHAIVENDANVELEDSTSAKKMKMT